MSDEEYDDNDSEQYSEQEERSDIEEKEPETEYEANFKDIKDTGADFEQKHERGDPITNALIDFKDAIKKLQCTTEETIDEIVLKLKNNTHIKLITLNMPLMAMAACFHIKYSGHINGTNVKQFIDTTKALEEHNAVNIIRYIKFYGTNV